MTKYGVKSVEPQCNGGMDMKKPIENQWVMFIFADRTGLEPATSAVTGRHSNQLNYRSLLRG